MDNDYVWIVRQVELTKIPQGQYYRYRHRPFDCDQCNQGRLDDIGGFWCCNKHQQPQVTYNPPKNKIRWGTIFFICVFILSYWYFWNIIDV